MPPPQVAAQRVDTQPTGEAPNNLSKAEIMRCLLERYVARELFPLIRAITDQPVIGMEPSPPPRLLLDIKRRIAYRAGQQPRR
ncbi:MAG: hypothetical protein LC808_07605 [Actinobacteria bacterium]|nr:hypothetical protein [Actinomycetota bacterium]